ncbi:MAG TPA: hypothetical protein PLF27_04645 [Sedimentibacter sp.]|nr:hypothetical protein [Sedimentibacter sp.]HRC80655.1 hypothetical protein [Sedimentibacter sp.]
MYEIRQQRRKELREKKWFYYAILAIGIFVFSQGCSLMSRNPGYAATAAVLGLLLHNGSVDRIYMSIFNHEAHKYAKFAMLIILCIIAVFSYFKRLGFPLFVLLDLCSVLLFAIIAFICQKLTKQQE